MAVRVEFVQTRSQKRAFLHVPFIIHDGDANWIPPLHTERKELLDERINPFFLHGEVGLFIALSDGKPVGRISAQVDRLEISARNDKTGFFGFFDALDDANVVGPLVSAAKAWLRERSIVRMVGPYAFNINGESGVLIEGFDSPPYVLMNHNPRYYAPRLEEQGLRKAKDLLAWHYKPGTLPPLTRVRAEHARRTLGLSLRNIDLNSFSDDIDIIRVLFNASWRNNWGFLPYTKEEFAWIAGRMKRLIDPSLILLAFLDGAPIAMAVAIPNTNELLRDLDGRMFPFRWARLLWRVARHRYTGVRIVLLGIHPSFRNREDLKWLSVLLYAELDARMVKRGYREAEWSWSLEDNTKINGGFDRLGAIVYKRYRLFETDV